MKSIFDLENRLDITNEYEKLIYAFYEDDNAVVYEEDAYTPRTYASLMEVIDKRVFLKWKYRDTFLNVEEYLEHIGIDYEQVLTYGNHHIERQNFLYFLEFIANMTWLFNLEPKIELSNKAKAYIENIPRILEKMNYTLKELDDKVIITKRNSDVDTILTKVPDNIAHLLLEYNDFRISDDIKAKKAILKAIDLYLDKDNKKIKKQIRGIDNALVDTFETILNNMGINHQNENEVFTSISDEEKNEWYDKCFLLMIHGIRAIDVNEIKKERAELVKK